MATELNYQQAGRIREQSIGSLFADQLIAGKGYKEGFKNVLSLKSKATVKGIKEKFDPLNIAKVLTGGSRLGPAIVGKMLGRSKKDIEYFAGKANPIFEKISKISQMNGEEEDTKGNNGKKGKQDNLKGVKGVLNKILTFLNKSYDKEVTLQEKENNFKESNKLADDKRHNEMLKVLAGISGGNAEEEKKGNKPLDIFKKIREKIKLGIRNAVEKVAAKKVAEVAIKTGVATIPTVATASGAVLTEEVVQKTTGTILKEEAGKAAAKSVPFIGAGIEGGIAINRAVNGDWYGAGISTLQAGLNVIPYIFYNPATGIVAPGATAAAMAGTVALTAYDITRSVYKEIFNTFPEEEKDSDLRKQRMSFIFKTVTQMLGSNLQTIKKDEVPNPAKLDEQIKNTETTVTSLNDQIGQAKSEAVMGNKYSGGFSNISNLTTQRDEQQKRLDNLKNIKEQQSKNPPLNENNSDDKSDTATPVSKEDKFLAEWGVPDNYQLPTGWSKKEIQKEIVDKGFKYNKKDNDWINPKEYDYDPKDPQSRRFMGKWRLNSDGTYTRQYDYRGLNVETLSKDLEVIKSINLGALDKKSLTSPLNENSKDVQTAMANPNMQPKSMDSTNKIYDTLDQKQMANLDLNIDKNIPKTNQNPPQKDNVIMAANGNDTNEKHLSEVSLRDERLRKTISNLTVTV